MLIDTHAHYNCDAYNGIIDELLTRLFSENICGIIDCCAEPKDFDNSYTLSQTYDKLYSAYGLHPEALQRHSLPELLATVRDIMPNYLKKDGTIALGECGLDYYYDMDRGQQKELFCAQLELAAQFDLPVLIHNREAHADTLDILKQYRPRFVMHCYSGSVEYMHEVTKLGGYIGLGGVVTFKNAKTVKEVAAAVPHDRLLIETDCPYLAPVPHRGKQCHSGMMKYTVAEIATLRGEEINALEQQLLSNTAALFGDVF